MITGISAHLSFTCRISVIPSLSGILMSKRISENTSRFMAARASSADLARVTSKLSHRTFLQLSSTIRSSYTTRIFIALHDPPLERHPDGERAAFSHLTLNPNATPVPLDDSERHGQAEPCSLTSAATLVPMARPPSCAGTLVEIRTSSRKMEARPTLRPRYSSLWKTVSLTVSTIFVSRLSRIPP